MYTQYYIYRGQPHITISKEKLCILYVHVVVMSHMYTCIHVHIKCVLQYSNIISIEVTTCIGFTFVEFNEDLIVHVIGASCAEAYP